MEYLILLVLALVLVYFFNKNKQIKNPAVKKEEIIDSYEKELKRILSSCDENIKKEEKLKFIKKVNSELNRNIFFTEEEAKIVLQKLISIS